MRSHLYLAADVPRDPETGAEDTAHFPLRELDDSRLAIHAHPTAEIPEGVEVIRDGRAAEWEWDGLAATHPTLYAALCVAEILDPEGAAIGTGYRPPHYWTDDQPPSE